MPLTPGTHLGPYEIVAPLGAGGMGEVYRARDARLGREVAVKVLPAAVASSPDRLARFEREARAVAALSHPNIVVLHSIDEAGAIRFLTMELVEGESLDRHVVPGGLPLARVLDLAIPLADALAAAHAKGVVHRDLKPANVMVTREARIKVLDFGLAKLAQAESEPSAAQSMTMESPVSVAGQVVGTVPYMAPEQIRGEAVDARADLFSLGVILYELIGGRRPFTGATSADVSSAVLRDTPAPVASLRPDLPVDVARIVGRCLEKDPRDRFQTARDVYNELCYLRREVDRRGGGAVPAPAPTPAPMAASAPPSTPAPASSPPQGIPSIAVLPFVNMSRDEENEYFSDGLAEELLNVLAKIRGLRVAARSSAFTFKGKSAAVAEVGQALNVATVLEGSVRKAGNRVRIAVQLVKVEDGFHLWSETYDRTLEDIFAVQDDIAQAVVKELRTTLLGAQPDSDASDEARADVAAAAKGRGESGEAHRLFLEGRYLVYRLAAEDLAKGVGLLRRAVEVDPRHAQAWACLSFAYSVEAGLGFAPIAEGNVRARDAARRSLELEPDLVEGHLALGTVQHWHDWDWKGAEASYRRALAQAPGNAEALRLAAMLSYALGRPDEALALGRRAVEQDPLALTSHAFYGRVLRGAGRFEEAEKAFRRALEISPDSISLRILLAWTLEAQGRREEAFAEALAEKADWARLFALAILNHRAGRAAESDRALRELKETRAADAAFQIAMAHAMRGEPDAAFEWLDRAYEQRDSGCTLCKLEPLLRPLHADPRWTAFLAKMGLAD